MAVLIKNSLLFSLFLLSHIYKKLQNIEINCDSEIYRDEHLWEQEVIMQIEQKRQIQDHIQLLKNRLEADAANNIRRQFESQLEEILKIIDTGNIINNINTNRTISENVHKLITKMNESKLIPNELLEDIHMDVTNI